MAEQSPAPVMESLLRRPWVQQVLPFLTSVMVHAGVALIGVVFFPGGGSM